MLLLVVHRHYVHLSTFSIGSRGGDCTALSVGGNDDTACRGDLPIFLAGQFERVGVNYFVRPCVGGWVSKCLLYTSDAADERSSVDLGGRRIIKKKKKK